MTTKWQQLQSEKKSSLRQTKQLKRDERSQSDAKEGHSEHNQKVKQNKHKEETKSQHIF